MHMDLTVGLERAFANQSRELTSGPPTGEIHLEEAVLRVEEARGASHILA